MTNNINVTPNRLLIHGDTRTTHFFGAIKSVAHSHPGGHPCLRVEYEHDLTLEISLDTAAETARRFTAALSAPELKGHIA